MRVFEYVVLYALVSVAAIGVLTAMGGTFDNVFRAIAGLMGG